jgi:hypothetical protein
MKYIIKEKLMNPSLALLYYEEKRPVVWQMGSTGNK